jgi:hypothetical protein
MTMIARMPAVLFFGIGLALMPMLDAQTPPVVKRMSLVEQARQSYQDELLQTRAYCQNLEVRLSYIRKQFPSLAADVSATESAWSVSPFGRGDKAVQALLVKMLGEQESRSQVFSRMDQAMPTSDRLINFQEAESARRFLKSVSERSQGRIDDRQVRGTLLANYAPFQDRSETEWDAGFSEQVTHTTAIGPYLFFRIPMSWKRSHHPDLTQDQMVYTSGYGQGLAWVSIQVRPSIDDTGKLVLAEQSFVSQAAEPLRMRCRKAGSDLVSYEKTKLLGLPAILLTIHQPEVTDDPYAARIVQSVQYFSGTRVITFQFHVIQPPNSPPAERTQEKFQPIFDKISRSLTFAPES